MSPDWGRGGAPWPGTAVAARDRVRPVAALDFDSAIVTEPRFDDAAVG
jgi:hypothetical protein